MALAGLLTHLGEGVEAPGPMVSAHLNIDILRPTPFEPVRAVTRVVRPGRRMQIVEVDLIARGQVTARARILRLRQAPSPHVAEAMPYPPPEETPPNLLRDGRSRIGALTETRGVPGDFGGPDSAVIWARFHADIVPGAPAAGIVQAAMLADFGNGLSCCVDRDHWTYANVDITVHMVRAPLGDWMLIAAETVTQGLGVGLVNSVLADRNGPFARAHQTLFIDRRRVGS